MAIFIEIPTQELNLPEDKGNDDKRSTIFCIPFYFLRVDVYIAPPVILYIVPPILSFGEPTTGKGKRRKGKRREKKDKRNAIKAEDLRLFNGTFLREDKPIIQTESDSF